MKKKAKVKPRTVKAKKRASSFRPTCASNLEILNKVRGSDFEHQNRLEDIEEVLRQQSKIMAPFIPDLAKLKSLSIKQAKALEALKFDHTGLKDFRSEVSRDGEDLAVEVDEMKEVIDEHSKQLRTQRTPADFEKKLNYIEEKTSQQHERIRELKIDNIDLKDSRADNRRDGYQLTLEVNGLKEKIAQLEYRLDHPSPKGWFLKLWRGCLTRRAKI